MSPHSGLSLAVFTLHALATVPSAPQGEEHGAPALFSWADFDGDGRLDLAAVNAGGTLQLLASADEGRFEDVTEPVGLAGVADAALALWGDYDGDLRLDLFVGAREGASRLFHNEGGSFVDMSAGSGLHVEGAVRSARWLDHDGDGRLDLHVVTAERHMLLRGLEGGFFEAADLPLEGAPTTTPSARSDETRPASSEMASASVEDRRDEVAPAVGAMAPAQSAAPTRTSVGKVAGADESGRLFAMPAPTCLASIENQANPGSCLQASTTPTLGRLYPISTNLFVAVSGEVGIGTTSPAAKLDVAGTARIADTLTLAPSSDQALNVSTGSIYKSGALFIHTRGSGFGNTGVGESALSSVTSGFANTACGNAALVNNTIGFRNTAVGTLSLRFNTTGARNTAIGTDALRYNTTGSHNTATGAYALEYTTSSNNTASGAFTLQFNTTGFRNTASGTYALRNNTTGSSNTTSGAFGLYSNTSGSFNTASGVYALRSNTTGFYNTANGERALERNTTGFRNTASGSNALRYNTTGAYNTASGRIALYNNTNGNDNTAFGFGALFHNTSGSNNIGLGLLSGRDLTTGSGNIDIGNLGFAGEAATIRIGTASTQTRAFIAGIRGVTTGVANAIPVVIDSNGQLGTVSSSARFKEEIRDMGDLTDRLLELRPVVFRYKPEVQTGERPLEYGLIAEEVAEVFPELVVLGDDGKPFTVKYHLLASMLLNELAKEVEARRALDVRLASQVEGREHELDDLRARVLALEARAAPDAITH